MRRSDRIRGPIRTGLLLASLLYVAGAAVEPLAHLEKHIRAAAETGDNDAPVLPDGDLCCFTGKTPAGFAVGAAELPEAAGAVWAPRLPAAEGVAPATPRFPRARPRAPPLA